MDNQKSPTIIDLAMEASRIEQDLMSASDPDEMLEMILKRLDTDLSLKADHYHFAMERLESTAEILKARADEFSAAAKVLSNARERMKDRIKVAMQIMNTREIRGADIVFKLSQPSQKVVIDSQLLPKEYLIEEISYKPNREKIEALTSMGEVIDGVQVKETSTLRVSINKGNKK